MQTKALPATNKSIQLATNNAFVQSHHNVGNRGVKRKSNTTQKSLIETIEKVNAAPVNSINRIHEVNIQIENKQAPTQDEIL